MLNNRKVLKRLIALLRSIDPKTPLPEELEERLWQVMIVEKFWEKEHLWVREGEIPGKAFYVVSGMVMVYAWHPDGYRHLYRIYRENTIVALKCFMDQTPSAYDIVTCRGTLLWSISDKAMKAIYTDMDGMREMALNTALTYSEAKEKLRTDLLMLNVLDRVLKFYQLFAGLLPPKFSPIRDQDIADFLLLSIDIFRRARKKLKALSLLIF
ncbi:MAG: Crp/Fnr family transcriptional regulator [Bacteroidota bacterium]